MQALNIDETIGKVFLHEVGFNMSLEWEIGALHCVKQNPVMNQDTGLLREFGEPDFPKSALEHRCCEMLLNQSLLGKSFLTVLGNYKLDFLL